MITYSKNERSVFMRGNTQLAKEIVENASMIPVECQERILEIIKAMVFTRKVIEKSEKSSTYECHKTDV